MSTIYAQKALLPSGWEKHVRMEIVRGHIARIDVDAADSPADFHADVVIPGLANAHSHAFQRALAGWTERRAPAGKDDFWTWRERMYALVPLMTARELRVVARQAFIEMLSRGYTSVVEFHYLHSEPGSDAADDSMFKALRDAASEAGIRLCYVPVLYERAGFASKQAQGAQRHFALDLEAFLAHFDRARSGDNALLSIGIGAHSIRAASETSLARIASVANSENVPMHIHIAEQRAEVEQCLNAHRRRPVEWLLETFPVESNWCLVHATHVEEHELREMAASDAVVCLCPSTEANLGDGLFPLANYLRHEGKIAIGSDSNITINAFEELRWLEYGQRLNSESRNIVSLRNQHVGHELFHRTLDGGAQASGRRDGGLVPGGPADLLTLDGNDPMLAGHGDASRLDALIFSGLRLPIESVMTGGEWTIHNGIHLQAASSRTEFKDTVERLAAQVDQQ